MHARRWTALLLPLLLAPTIACSDNAGDTHGAHVSTGLPADQKFSSFDDEDAKIACQALNDAAGRLISMSELVRAQCASFAIGETVQVNDARTDVSVDITECDELAMRCESDPASYGVTPQEPRYESDCSHSVANERVMECDATVADYEACISKVLDQAKESLAKTSCAHSKELILSDGAATNVVPANIPECKAFLTQCPNIQIAVSNQQE